MISANTVSSLERADRTGPTDLRKPVRPRRLRTRTASAMSRKSSASQGDSSVRMLAMTSPVCDDCCRVATDMSPKK